MAGRPCRNPQRPLAAVCLGDIYPSTGISYFDYKNQKGLPSMLDKAITDYTGDG